MSPRTRVKICGLTRPADAAHAVAAGADFLGLNFWAGSKRHLALADAPAVAAAARGAGVIQLIGVFVNATLDDIEAAATTADLDLIQLHGDEPPALVDQITARTGLPVWKALAVRAPDDLADLSRWHVAALLLDAPSVGRGGSGHTFDWSLARAAVDARPARPIVLAGGLTPANVAAAVVAVAPWAVDVASGVEAAPGEKDPARVTAFLAAVRGPR